MIEVRIPTILRPAVGGADRVAAAGSNVGEVLRGVAEQYPRFESLVFERDGSIKRYMSVFLGDQDVRHLRGQDTPVPEGSELVVLVAASGGATGGYEDLVADARRRIRETSAAELAARLDDPPVIVDIREPHETATGSIPGAVLVPLGILERTIPRVVASRDAEMVLYCSVGSRSALAAAVLAEMGYSAASSLAGGITAWRIGGYPLQMPAEPGGEARHSRHLVLAEVGAEGQQRLAASRVLIVGAGGLGSPAALYLAAAGVGTLGIVDFDVVDVSNLQRQILHDTADIGRRKTDSAAEAIGRLDPGVVVETHPARLEASNVVGIASDYDLIVDGTDSFPVRYLINDAAVRLRKPLVHGSVLRFEGQVTVVDPYRGPCYRCVFPAPPPPEVSPSCSEAGVLGAVPGVVGSLQAVEALKVLLGAGDPLVARLLVYDGLAGEARVFSTARDPDCPACSDPDSPPPIVDYDETCRVPR
jgi:molybdopterin/thiamine biosynthesis adenylyltransferase/rhodanese-related sulfurtransferase/molybdopterin converting factor small subunit